MSKRAKAAREDEVSSTPRVRNQPHGAHRAKKLGRTGDHGTNDVGEVAAGFVAASRGNPKTPLLLDLVICEDGSFRAEHIEIPPGVVKRIEDRTRTDTQRANEITRVVVEHLLARVGGIAREPARSSASEAGEYAGDDLLPDDAIIDQTNDRLPDRQLYLRLARRGVFPSQKHGKKILARWGDVRDALCGAPTPTSPATDCSDDDEDQDRQLCRELLIVPAKKGNR